jgi:hypothetical protein
MAKFSLWQAAEQAEKSKSTISRAIKSGRLSAAKTDEGGFAIEASELFASIRPPRLRCAQGSVGDGATGTETAIRLAESWRPNCAGCASCSMR